MHYAARVCSVNGSLQPGAQPVPVNNRDWPARLHETTCQHAESAQRASAPPDTVIWWAGRFSSRNRRRAGAATPAASIVPVPSPPHAALAGPARRLHGLLLPRLSAGEGLRVGRRLPIEPRGKKTRGRHHAREDGASFVQDAIAWRLSNSASPLVGLSAILRDPHGRCRIKLHFPTMPFSMPETPVLRTVAFLGVSSKCATQVSADLAPGAVMRQRTCSVSAGQAPGSRS